MNGPFLLKVAIFMVLAVLTLTLLGEAATTTQERFGGVGWIHWIVGLLLFAASLIALWATLISLLDRWSIKRYRVSDEASIVDSQTVALAGTIRVDGEPITAPFSGTPSACVSYLIKGQHQVSSSGSTSTRSHSCVLGFGLAAAFLETGSRRLRLYAIADVDTDFRRIDSGRHWGEQAHEMIKRAAQSGAQTGAPEAHNALSAAQKKARSPISESYFVAPNRSSNVSVTEDAVPVDTEVTILAHYDAMAEALDGQRVGGMKVFAGGIDERLAGLEKEARVGLIWGIPMFALGVGLITLAMWWPS